MYAVVLKLPHLFLRSLLLCEKILVADGWFNNLFYSLGDTIREKCLEVFAGAGLMDQIRLPHNDYQR